MTVDAVRSADAVSPASLDGPAMPSGWAGVLRPLGHRMVRLERGGWLGGWQERTLRATLPHVLDRVVHGEARANLARLLDRAPAPFTGMVFTDSDVHKTLEAVAWAADRLEDETVMAGAEDLVALLAAVQEPDGYLNSWVQGDPERQRWSDPQWGHELYTAGHLFQAAVAAERCGVLPDLIGIATRCADLLVAWLGRPGSPYLDGHPEVETALVELYRLTGERAYLETARAQIERRGHGWLGAERFGSPYFQDGVPVREAQAATGHAVRQLYLLTGAADVAVETGDRELLAAVVRIWEDLAGTKTYITGAHGSRHRDEAIGDPYELPPDRAYAETCAAIASFQLAWRLLLATGESRFADAMETTLHNAVAAAVSQQGDRFFYSNPLHLRTGHDGGHEDAPSGRLAWFACACCPPNIARLLASIHDYTLTRTDDGIQLHHPTAASVEVPMGEMTVRLDLRTDYPDDGAIRVVVATASTQVWELALRVPGWCDVYTVQVDGRPVPASASGGYVRLRRRWQGQHEVVLDLDLPVRLVRAHGRVDAVRGCVAVARGPVVYALEQADLPSGTVLEDVRLVSVTGTCRLVTAAPAPVLIRALVILEPAAEALYRSVPAGTPAGHALAGSPAVPAAFEVTLAPYRAWANRDPGAMRVWIPISPGAARPTVPAPLSTTES